jgi:hypothetical protein
MRPSVWILASVVLVSGCFKLDFTSGALRCSSSNTCPGGYRCASDGACWKGNDGPPGSPPSGGSADMAANGGGGGGGSGNGGAPIASACTNDGDCDSGHCADGVCCNEACTDACKSCNLGTLRGKCKPVSAGNVPLAGHDTCPDDGGNSCQRNGVCDGLGQCQLYAAGTACAAGYCDANANAFVGVSKCDGKGTCVAPTAAPCDPFKCSPDFRSCMNSCVDFSQCVITATCTGTSCGLSANGASCTLGPMCTAQSCAQCKSTHCVDGVCCGAIPCGTCARDADCNADSFCDGSTCKPLHQIGDACTMPGQCRSRLCAGHKCVQCTLNSECSPATPVCTNNQCVANCTTSCLYDGDTYWGACKNGSCTCTQDTDCGSGRAPNCDRSTNRCVCNGKECPIGQLCGTDRICRAGPNMPCQVSTDCSSNVCISGLCARMASGTHCQYDTDCPFGQACSNGTCTSP